MKIIYALCITVMVSTAHATIIDFQDTYTGSCGYNGHSVSSRGFAFTGNSADPNLFVCNAGVLQNNDSAALINANSRSILTMTANNSSLFSLQSFFSGTRTAAWDPNRVSSAFGLATGLEIVGTFADMTTIIQSIQFNNLDWAQFSFGNGFTDLASVTFSALGSSSRPEFLIDNIVVNEAVAAIPEPSTILLLCVGLVGIGVAGRKS